MNSGPDVLGTPLLLPGPKRLPWPAVGHLPRPFEAQAVVEWGAGPNRCRPASPACSPRLLQPVECQAKPWNPCLQPRVAGRYSPTLMSLLVLALSPSTAPPAPRAAGDSNPCVFITLGLRPLRPAQQLTETWPLLSLGPMAGEG